MAPQPKLPLLLLLLPPLLGVAEPLFAADDDDDIFSSGMKSFFGRPGPRRRAAADGLPPPSPNRTPPPEPTAGAAGDDELMPTPIEGDGEEEDGDDEVDEEVDDRPVLPVPLEVFVTLATVVVVADEPRTTVLIVSFCVLGFSCTLLVVDRAAEESVASRTTTGGGGTAAAADVAVPDATGAASSRFAPSAPASDSSIGDDWHEIGVVDGSRMASGDGDVGVDVVVGGGYNGVACAR
uniref:Putative secreted protein n=1 Tax=Anopheles triannulatus TaxID=58253 RepID=A0A2M4B4M5_9DIPT